MEERRVPKPKAASKEDDSRGSAFYGESFPPMAAWFVCTHFSARHDPTKTVRGFDFAASLTNPIQL